MYKVFALTLILMISMQIHCLTDHTNLKCYKGSADVVFVLDASTSIWGPDFEKQLDFVNYFIEQNDIGVAKNQVRVGVVIFSTTAIPKIYLSDFNDKLELQKEVSNISQERGNTKTSLALDLLTSTMFTTEKGARKNIRHIAFILTDGSSQETEKTQLAAKRCREANIELFAIGIGNESDEVELKGIASEPKESHYIPVSNFSVLLETKKEILKQSCQTNDSIPLNTEEVCQNISADVFFLLDSSSSILPYEFNKQLNAVEDIIQTYSVGPDKLRIGMAIYSDYYKLVIDFENGVEKSTIFNKIKHTSHQGGGTKTGNALYRIRTEIFSERSDRKRFLIIFTDGQSYNRNLAIEESDKLKQDDVAIFSVGVGPFVDKNELKEISSYPSEEYVFNVENMDDLSKKVKYLSRKTCSKVEEMSKDQEYCNSTKITDFVFALSNNYLGHTNTAYILKVVGDIIERKTIREKFRFGMVFDQCPHLQDISFDSEDSNRQVQRKIFNYQNKPLYTIFEKLYNLEYLNSLNRRVSLVFVDESMDLDNPTVLEESIAKLHRKNIEIYIVAIGNKMNFKDIKFVPSDHIISIPSYKVLLPKFYSKFAKLFCIKTRNREYDLS